MPIVTFVLPDGTRREVRVNNGASAMTGAVQNSIQGILAECGGACTCATCHVYVDPDCIHLLPSKGALESSMLDAVVDNRRENSRLSCQIKVTPELDGRLVLHVPG